MKLGRTIAPSSEAVSWRRRRRVRMILGMVCVLGFGAKFPMQLYMMIAFPLMMPSLLLPIGGSLVYGFLVNALSAAAVLVAVYALLMALAPRKPTVLYLRRFRLATVAQAMSDAIESGVGRHYRILTLDDAGFVPLEVPRLERRLSRYGSLGPILGGLAVFFGVLWMTATIFNRYGYSIIGLGVLAVVAWEGFLTTFAPFVGAMLVYWILFLVPAFLIHRRRVRRRSQVAVATEEDLSACLEYSQTLSGRVRAPAFMAPQATVVKVVDALWQETVIGIARTAGAIFIDVSVPTLHVLWEIETATRDFRHKIVYIGQKPLVEQWMEAPTGEVGSEAGSKIRGLLEGATVLAYEPVSRASRRAFRKSLRNALDNLRIPRPEHFDIAGSWRGITTGHRPLLPPFWKAVLLYVGLAAACVPLSSAIWGMVWNGVLARLAGR